MSHSWPFGNAATGLLPSPQASLASIPFFVLALPDLEGAESQDFFFKRFLWGGPWYVLNDQPDHSSLAVGAESILTVASYHGTTWSLTS